MPKVCAVDERDEAELRAMLVSLLAEGFLRYMQSDQFAIDHADRNLELDSETACLEVSEKPVLSVTRRVNDR